MGVSGLRRWSVIAAWVVAAITGLLIPAAMPVSAAATAAASAVSASYTPAELEMLPGETRTVALLVENTTGVPVTATSTVAQTEGNSDPVTIGLDETAKSIPAGGSVALEATVKLVHRSAFPVTVVTTVAYTGPGGSGSAIASLKVTSGATPTAAPGALVITASGDAAMVDTSGADVIFTVQNNGATLQRITTATLTFPTFLQVKLADGSVSKESAGTMTVPFTTDALNAGNGTAIHLRVTAPKGVQPGNALITLSLNYDDAVSGTPAFSTGTHTIGLTVFGEEAVKGAFGAALAPALFVVPGLLFVLVLWFLWMHVYPRRFPVDMTPPSAISAAVALAILGVLCALPFPYLYRLVTGRDYIVVYSFADIGLMCALGIAVAVVAWGAGLGIRGIVRRYRFMPGDPAPTTFRKLTRGRRNLTQVQNALHVRHAEDPKDDIDGTVFILRVDGTKALVCPKITTPTVVENNHQYSLEFERLLTGKKNRKLYREVTKHEAATLPRYDSSSVSAVAAVDVADLKSFGRGRIVDQTG